MLALVDTGGRRFLLGMTDETIACLGELAPEADDRGAAVPPDAPRRETHGDRGISAVGLSSDLGAESPAPSTATPRFGVLRALAFTLAVLLATTTPAHAALPQLSFELGGSDGMATSIQLVLLFTLLSFAPAILIGVSAFVRIVIVLAFMRQAVGTPQMPPNQVVIALALFLTFFVMMPTLREVNAEAVVPYLEQSTPPLEAISKGFVPLRAFMMRQTREKDLALFLGIGHQPRPTTQADVPPEIVVPAFLISELKTAFQISFLIYIPFLVLDMVVASILTSMGMITLPPVLISLPFKLMIFVLVDGWNLLISSLIRSFQ
jgi:flagellar biosynthetic protein FliP